MRAGFWRNKCVHRIDGTVSIIFLVIIFALIAYLTITHKKEMLIEEMVD